MRGSESGTRGLLGNPRGSLLGCILIAACAAAMPVAAGNLVIVIDDLGYNLDRAERLLALDAPIVFALLPFAPHSPEIARRAAAAGRDIVLHQPMEALPAPHVRPAEGTLRADMPPAEFGATIEAALAALPGVVAVNNHKGSLLTADRDAMERFMAHVARHRLAFLDSRTTPRTVAFTTARAAQVPSIERDVFLDHVATEQAIAAAFDRALDLARTRGHAVAIGHPYELTIRFLETQLPAVPDDVRVVALSDQLGLTRRTMPVRIADRAYPDRSHGR